MKKEIKHIDVIQAGIVAGVLYALLSLIFMLLYAPFMGLFMSSASQMEEMKEVLPFMGGGIFLMLILVPIIYGILGFIFGVLSAFIYNLVAKWVGGYRFTLIDTDE